MKYRSRTEIASHILEAANGGATKTKIMYKAFLSFSQLKEYLGILVLNDLLANDLPAIYKTTSKGLRFLGATRKLDEMLNVRKSEDVLVSYVKTV
ncbi:MAG TPA: winged helix-turn-helix domain-containing protein [Nitrososphaera sp.]|jgi:predicted transcriptional regulator|nr:winged helix-turn-helix domain-containing protein [Nitrososphaera sp.]